MMGTVHSGGTVVGRGPDFGSELRRWRTQRRLSQLELASAAEVSQRHVSFLETGRSSPSPEMVLHLGRTLDLSLRDRNRLLEAAGFVPAFEERDLDHPDLEQVRGVLSTLLAAYGHFPAYVVDRHWNLVLSNPMATVLIGAADPTPPPAVASNALRLILHPEGVAPLVTNWEQVADSLLHRLDQELLHTPTDQALHDLATELRSYPGVGDLPPRAGAPRGDDLVLPIEFRLDDVELRFFTTITTIGAAYDVTLEELRLETLLPADAPTEQFLRALAPQAGAAGMEPGPLA